MVLYSMYRKAIINLVAYSSSSKQHINLNIYRPIWYVKILNFLPSFSAGSVLTITERNKLKFKEKYRPNNNIFKSKFDSHNKKNMTANKCNLQ